MQFDNILINISILIFVNNQFRYLLIVRNVLTMSVYSLQNRFQYSFVHDFHVIQLVKIGLFLLKTK